MALAWTSIRTGRWKVIRAIAEAPAPQVSVKVLPPLARARSYGRASPAASRPVAGAWVSADRSSGSSTRWYQETLRQYAGCWSTSPPA